MNSGYSFRDVFEALASARSFEEVLEVILATALRELSADQGSLLLVQGSGNEDHAHLKMLAARGLPPEIVERGYVARKGSISEYVLKERRPLILNDEVTTRKYETLGAEKSTPRKIRSALCVPLIARGTVIGTMNLNRTTAGSIEFGDSDLEACSILAGQAAIVIENRRLHEELLQKERLAAVGQTVACISHCIKNILAGVKGGVGLTQMGIDQENNELLHQGFDLLKRSTGTLGNLVLDLLDYSIEREPMREAFNLAAVLRDVVSALKFKAEAAGVRLEFVSESEVSFYGDADQIYRAALNLVTNAIEATAEHRPGSGNVELAVRKAMAAELGCADTRDHVEIRVEDNGPGITAEQRDRIWDLFYSTKGSRGTGIGLAATRKMVEEHEGVINLISEPGEGTLFQVLLPVTRS